MKGNRLIALALVLCIVLAWVPVTASAAEVASGTCGKNVTWMLTDDGLLTITGSGEMFDYGSDLLVPWYGYRDTIYTVTIDDNITSIGDAVFAGCKNLISISVGDDIQTIGDNAFSNCEKLSAISLPDTVRSLGNYAFTGCASLTSFTVPENVIGIPNSIFEGCSSLANVSLPANLVGIGYNAFSRCNSLEIITIPKKVNNIGDAAFSFCTNLKAVYFEGNAPYFDIGTFAGVTANCYYPEGNSTWTPSVMQDYFGTLTWISYSQYKQISCGFTETVSLGYGESIQYSFTPETTGEYVFYGPWPNGMGNGVDVYIKWNVYYEEESVGQSTWSTDFDSQGFEGVICTMEAGKTYILKLQSWCYGVEEVIGDIHLDLLTEPETIRITGKEQMLKGSSTHFACEVISGQPFFNSDVNWTISDERVLKLEYNYGGEVYLTAMEYGTVTVTATLKNGVSASLEVTVSNFEEGLCGDNVIYELSEDGTLIISGTGDMWNFAYDETMEAFHGWYDEPLWDYEVVTTIAVESGVTTIGNRAFSGCANLTSVTLPEELVSIGSAAFFRCDGMTSITIPDNVISIGSSAFLGCDNLVSLIFCGDAPTFGRDVFYGVTATCYYPKDNATWTSEVMQDHYDTITWVAYDPCDFGHSYEAVVTDPTCTEQGYTTHTCTVCGDSYVDSYVDATGHSYGEWYVVTEATCTANGEERRECTDCDHYETRATELADHTYESVVTAPTCTEQGYTTHTCAVCGDTTVDSYVDALGHSYESVVTAPTCTEQGYTTHTCAVCGDSYVDSYVDATGHIYGDWYTVIEATCTANGEERRDCAACDHYETRATELMDHSYESVVTAPTCTEQGCTTYTCAACGDSYVDAYVDALGHNYESVVTAPTYEEQGYTTHTCTLCGDSYVDNYVAALIHHEVLEGDNAEWSEETEVPVSIRVDADIALFVEVRLNGKVVAPENYTVTQGSTIVTLKPEYLATLPAGEYTMELVFTDGSAEATFHVTSAVVLGDLNGDGEVDIFDANLIVAYYNGTADLTAEQQKAADVNNDGEIDIFDANLIVSFYNGTLTAFPGA